MSRNTLRNANGRVGLSRARGVVELLRFMGCWTDSGMRRWVRGLAPAPHPGPSVAAVERGLG